jgi:hypothetical protein
MKMYHHGSKSISSDHSGNVSRAEQFFAGIKGCLGNLRCKHLLAARQVKTSAVPELLVFLFASLLNAHLAIKVVVIE